MLSEAVGKDYAAYCEIDLKNKLTPVSSSIDNMLARMEELQTMLTFVKQDRTDATDSLKSFVTHYKQEFDELCDRIDTLENLMSHVKDNLNGLEAEIERNEAELGCPDNSIKVSNIFTPLFKKNSEKSPETVHAELFKTENYFK